MLSTLSSAPENAVVMLHAVGHNPTGLDPSKEEWRKIAELCRERNLFPLLDMAYLVNTWQFKCSAIESVDVSPPIIIKQGLATGDIDKDAWTVRHFDQLGLEFMVAASFCKNFTLYSERPGALLTVVKDK